MTPEGRRFELSLRMRAEHLRRQLDALELALAMAGHDELLLQDLADIIRMSELQGVKMLERLDEAI